MVEKISLSDITLEDLHLIDILEEYKPDFDFNKTIGDNIYNYLNSKSGLIQHKRHINFSNEKELLFQETFRNTVSKGSPITIFISSFSPKITNPLFTNNHLLPDMADLLTIVHLHLLAKHVKGFYDYGFRFIIAFRGNSYRPVFRWNDATIEKSYAILKELIKHAERITGIRNVVEIVDFMDLVKHEGTYFENQWKEEIERVRKLYDANDELVVRKINGWLRDYKKSVNQEDFCDIEDFDAYMFEQALSFRALKNTQFVGGIKGVGVCNSLPPTIRPSVRGIDNNMSLQINPYFEFHSHQRLIMLDETNKWFTFEWSEKASEVSPVYAEELDYPFYFVPKI